MSMGSWLGRDESRRRLSWLRRRALSSPRPRSCVQLELRELEPRRVLDANGFLDGLPHSLDASLRPGSPLHAEPMAAEQATASGPLESTPGETATELGTLAFEPLAVEAQSVETLVTTAEFQIQLIDQQLVIESLVPGRVDHLAVIFDRNSVVVRSGEFSNNEGPGGPQTPVETLLVLPLKDFTGDVLVRTDSGNDSLIVSHIFPPTARNVRYEGGDGQDVLYLEGVATASTSVRLTGSDSALVHVHGDRQIEVDTTETISSWIESNDVAVQWSDARDDVELRDSRFSDRLEIVTVDAPDVYFNHPSHQTRLETGGGDDAITINGWGDQLRTEFRVDGQTGDDTIIVNRSLDASHVDLAMTAERTVVRESLAIGRLAILANELVISAHTTNTGNGVVRLSTERSSTLGNAELFIGGAVRLESHLDLAADGRLTIGGPIDSSALLFRNLSIQSGDSGVSLGGSVGDGAADGSSALGRIQVNTSGTITWPDDIVFRTQTGSVSHVPLQLQVGPKDPTRPFGGDQQRVQQLTGLAGGSPQIASDFAGENLVLTIRWDDGHTSSFAVSGGDQVTLVSLTGQADRWSAVPTSSTPITFTDLGHQYTIDYLVSIVEQGRKFVEAQLELTSDPSIQLIGRPAPQLAPTDLISVSTTVRSSVTVGQILFALQPVEFEPPRALVHSEPVLVLQESRPSTPQINQTVDQATGVEVNSNATRELVIVTVGAEGEELESYALPPDALINLQGLLQRFIDEGLPNGRYRIYLREVGFPVRKILEFYKSGTSIGTPVRELGPGANPVQDPETRAPQQDTPPNTSLPQSTKTNGAENEEPADTTAQPPGDQSNTSTSTSISSFSAGARWRRRLLNSPSRMDG